MDIRLVVLEIKHAYRLTNIAFPLCLYFMYFVPGTRGYVNIIMSKMNRGIFQFMSAGC